MFHYEVTSKALLIVFFSPYYKAEFLFSIAISSIENQSDGYAASITQITDYVLDIDSPLQIFHKKSIHFVLFW